MPSGSAVDHQVRILEGGGPGGHSPGIGVWKEWGLQSTAHEREMFRASLLTPRTFDTPQPQGAMVGFPEDALGLSNRGGTPAELSQEQQDHSFPLHSSGLDFLWRPASSMRQPLAQHPWVLEGNQNFLP